MPVVLSQTPVPAQGVALLGILYGIPRALGLIEDPPIDTDVPVSRVANNVPIYSPSLLSTCMGTPIDPDFHVYEFNITSLFTLPPCAARAWAPIRALPWTGPGRTCTAETGSGRGPSAPGSETAGPQQGGRGSTGEGNADLRCKEDLKSAAFQWRVAGKCFVGTVLFVLHRKPEQYKHGSGKAPRGGETTGTGTKKRKKVCSELGVPFIRDALCFPLVKIVFCSTPGMALLFNLKTKTRPAKHITKKRRILKGNKSSTNAICILVWI